MKWNLKLYLIHLLDIIDNYIIGHRIYNLCAFISNSNWWGENIAYCPCKYCAKYGTDSNYNSEV